MFLQNLKVVYKPILLSFKFFFIFNKITIINSVTDSIIPGTIIFCICNKNFILIFIYNNKINFTYFRSVYIYILFFTFLSK